MKKGDETKVDGKKEASLLLAGLDSDHRERILLEIAQKDPVLAETLRKGLFNFQQVLALEPLELHKVIQAHPPRLFALSLRGLEPEAKKTLFTKFSERQARAIEEEIQALGPQKMADVKLAQEKIVAHAAQLHEKKEIKLGD